MLRSIVSATTVAVILTSPFAAAESLEVTHLKEQIIELAKSYEGQGDPDQSLQKTIEPLVQELIELNPMPPVHERIPILAGVWKQVWGPYDYRNDNGGIDPTLGIKEIYQVVFADGYYYNVAPQYSHKKKAAERIGLLRGEFKVHRKKSNVLRVKFTKYSGVKHRPKDMEIWELPSLAEAGDLKDKITIVPKWIVRLFFHGGSLEEVYTDQDLRILYGSSDRSNARRNLYIMSRVPGSKLGFE